MNPVQIEVLTGPQGGGKSTIMRDDAIARPGRYLFALPTHELIDEQVAAFRQAEPELAVYSVYSKTGKGPTVRRLTELRKAIEAANIGHCAVFTTHATLMDHDLNGFKNWHARIDEAPASVQAGRFNISLSLRYWLKETFHLDGGPDWEWSAPTFKSAKPDWKDVERDTGVSGLSEFIKQAKQPNRVFVKVRSWEDTADIEWFSMWTPFCLSHFTSVQIAGSGYTDSVGFRATQNFFENKLGVTIREIAPARSKQPAISIHYFTRGHEGTTTYWEKHEGLRMLAPVEKHLVKNLPPSAFWSGNKIIETVMYGQMRAQFIKPLAMGLNKHRAATACAFIYSAKAKADDAPVMEVFGLTEEQIRHAREDEAIAQFVMRGAIRDLDYSGPYDIYLYSQSQAERLEDHLVKIGFNKVDLVSVDEAGIMDGTRPKKGRRPLTQQQKAVSAKKRQKKDTARKQLDRAKAKKNPPPVVKKIGRPTGSKDKQPRRRRARGQSIIEPRIGVQKLDPILQATEPHPFDGIVHQDGAAKLAGLQPLPAQETVRGAVEDRAQGT